MSGKPQEQGADFGFDEVLGDVAAEFEDWMPNQEANDKPQVDRATLNRAAQEVGYTSREPSRPAIAKEPEEGSLTVRAKTTDIKRFKDLAKAQTPKWPHGYLLERALNALEKELEG